MTTETLEAEVEEQPETAIIVQGEYSSPMNFKEGMGLCPVEQQETILGNYTERRSYFLGWLKAQLQEGVHYGFPPGCKAKEKDSLQWKAKPSLYQSGAFLLIDLLKLKPVFSADKDAWEQLGSEAGHFVIKCELVGQTGEILGEGRGCRKVGYKGMNANASLKMAQKSAAVDAVLHTVPVVADLFTQDEPAEAQAKLTVNDLKNAIVRQVSIELKTRKSQWPGTPKEFIKKVIFSETKSNASPVTIGAVKAIEKALFEKGLYDWDTAEKIPS